MTSTTNDERVCAATRQIQSLLLPSGELQVSIVTTPLPRPRDDEVIVRIEAAPINPSDLGQLFGLADMDSLGNRVHGGLLTANVPPAALEAMAARCDVALPTGNEGAGTVVDSGDGAHAKSLLGKVVALSGSGMYADLRCVGATDCLELPAGTGAAEGASSFVNPLTALGFVETARQRACHAFVHTAAASNLGRMLNRLCLKDGLALVNVVRSPAQASLLRSDGAAHVVDASQPGFVEHLTDAIAATGATLGFDAVAGGPLAGVLLSCMERALNRKETGFSRYGSATHKHVYVYGGLQPGAIEIRQDIGKAWSVGGWLLTTFLNEIGPARRAELQARVAADMTTTFASAYSHEIALAQVLDAAIARRYARRATGEKYLVRPQLDRGCDAALDRPPADR